MTRAFLIVAICCAAVAKAQDVPSGSAGRGAALFQAHCVLCHGKEARGCGPAARFYSPRPANLTASTRTPRYKMRIIRDGGASMGRSAVMPSWSSELSGQDIADLVAHLSTLERKPDAQC